MTAQQIKNQNRSSISGKQKGRNTYQSLSSSLRRIAGGDGGRGRQNNPFSAPETEKPNASKAERNLPNLASNNHNWKNLRLKKFSVFIAQFNLRFQPQLK